jgi:hypothetical protein
MNEFKDMIYIYNYGSRYVSFGRKLQHFASPLNPCHFHILVPSAGHLSIDDTEPYS